MLPDSRRTRGRSGPSNSKSISVRRATGSRPAGSGVVSLRRRLLSALPMKPFAPVISRFIFPTRPQLVRSIMERLARQRKSNLSMPAITFSHAERTNPTRLAYNLHPMRYHKLDLNLLTALKTFLTQRNATHPPPHPPSHHPPTR